MRLSLTNAPIGSAWPMASLYALRTGSTLPMTARRSRGPRGLSAPPSRSWTCCLPRTTWPDGLHVGFRQHPARRHGPVAPPVPLVHVLHPHLRELRDDVLPDLAGLGEVLHVRQESEDLVAARAPSGPELEAALGEVVQHGHALGHLRRMVHLWERVEDPCAEVDPLRRPGQIAQHDVVGREVRVLVEEVVLGDPRVLEAGPVGRLDELYLPHERRVLGPGSPSGGARDVALNEEAEFHRTVKRSRRGCEPTIHMLKYWFAGPVGLGERDTGAVDLVLAGHAPDLQRGLGEAQQARGADRIRREHATGHVDRERAADRGRPVLDHLPALAGLGEVVAFQPHGLVPAEGHVELGAVDLLTGLGDAGLAVDVGGAVRGTLRGDRVASGELHRLRAHRRAEDPGRRAAGLGRVLSTAGR